METNKNHNENDHSEHRHDSENHKNHNHANDQSGDDTDYASPDKYLALEQPGVSYTPEKDHVSNSDNLEYGNDEARAERWKAHDQNSRNSDAFNQDDYILRDNIDLDEDQANSISADDAPDTNTTDETL